MKAPAFWWNEAPTPLARLLAPLGYLYGKSAGRRMQRPGARAALPVLCVGNFVAGGAGKTPLVAAVCAELEEAGHRPAVLSRGYGGSQKGPLLVDPEQHDAAEVGDEPLMLAKRLPVIVARDRPAGAALAAAHGASAIVMDDGLQNPSLAKDLTLAAVDAQVGIGNGLILPAGPLRAPLETQVAHVDAIVLIGRGEAGMRVADAAARAGKWVLSARLEPHEAMASALYGQRALAFAGIGRPDKFFATLREIGVTLASTRSFADHRPYGWGDLQGLLQEAQAKDLVLVTTQKDAARLPRRLPDGFRDRLAVLPVRLAIDDRRTLLRLLADRGIIALPQP